MGLQLKLMLPSLLNSILDTYKGPTSQRPAEMSKCLIF